MRKALQRLGKVLLYPIFVFMAAVPAIITLCSPIEYIIVGNITYSISPMEAYLSYFAPYFYSNV